jgi:mono/diheme cytochrome c family protein
MLASVLSLALLTAPDAPDPAHVREVLATKCAQCHGPKVARPKGHFGFITDLKRLAADPTYVVPGDPAGSFLWNRIEDGEMPPDKAKAGPLTDDEKTVIVEWIKAGAPAPADDVSAPDPTDQAERSVRAEAPASRSAPEPDRNPRSLIHRVGELLGKFHILTIHFPIALLAAAAMGELWSAVRGRAAPLPAVRFCLWLGAAGALASAGLGWLHAYYMDEPGQLLMLHRWIGTAAGALAPIVACVSERDARAAVRRRWVRWAIVALGILTGVAGHFGGMLVHGSNFLSF